MPTSRQIRSYKQQHLKSARILETETIELAYSVKGKNSITITDGPYKAHHFLVYYVRLNLLLLELAGLFQPRSKILQFRLFLPQCRDISAVSITFKPCEHDPDVLNHVLDCRPHKPIGLRHLIPQTLFEHFLALFERQDIPRQGDRSPIVRIRIQKGPRAKDPNVMNRNHLHGRVPEARPQRRCSPAYKSWRVVIHKPHGSQDRPLHLCLRRLLLQ